MRIIVAGSRDVTSYEVVRQAFIQSGYWGQFGRDIEIISGTARGVDKLGEEFAKKNGLECHRFPADWTGLGRGAGHIRNKEMGNFAKEVDGRLLAVWDGKSKGTEQMINYARSIDLGEFTFRTDKPSRYAVIGMRVKTDFSGKWTEHTIDDKRRDSISQSGVQFKLQPPVPKSDDGWIDADWFTII